MGEWLSFHCFYCKRFVLSLKRLHIFTSQRYQSNHNLETLAPLRYKNCMKNQVCLDLFIQSHFVFTWTMIFTDSWSCLQMFGIEMEFICGFTFNLSFLITVTNSQWFIKLLHLQSTFSHLHYKYCAFCHFNLSVISILSLLIERSMLFVLHELSLH